MALQGFLRVRGTGGAAQTAAGSGVPGRRAPRAARHTQITLLRSLHSTFLRSTIPLCISVCSHVKVGHLAVMAALRRALSLVACAAARPAAPCAARSFAAAAASEAASSSSAAASGVGAASPAAASPGYTITDAPGLAAPDAGAAAKSKWGRYVLKGIKGHTKKLNPIARQVRTAAGGRILRRGRTAHGA